MAGNGAGVTGQRLRVAVIDSGVHASHPHIGGVRGGVTIGEHGEESSYVDTLGHGTAVMAAIKEKAPQAEYFAVKVFQSELRAGVDVIVRAIEWCLDNRIDILNLSFGTCNAAHAGRFQPLVARAAQHGTILVSARKVNGIPAFPGSLPGVLGVCLDWDCQRDSYSCSQTPEGFELRASGYPRSIPGVPQERNLQGISFAVANMTGFVARACEGMKNRSYENVVAALVNETDRIAARTGRVKHYV
jgi:subtilisin family serine protease